MLSIENQQLARRDRDLPGLSLVLDPDRLAHVLRGGSDRCLPTVQIKYLRYKPGRRCLVLFTVNDGRTQQELVAAAYNEQGWRKHVKTVDAISSVSDAFSRNELAFAQVSIHSASCDRRLRIVEQLSSHESALNFVRSFVDRRCDENQLCLQRVAYKPARRAVYEVNSAIDRRFALKFFDQATFEEAKQRALAWDGCRPSLSAQGVEIPKLRRVDSKRRFTVSRWLSGDNLAQSMAIGPVPCEVFERVGSALAKLHSSSPRDLDDHCDTEDEETFRRLAKDVAFLNPGTAAKAILLATDIWSALHALPKRFAPIHGDFYAKQICIADDSIGILDFDQSIVSHPLRDVGNFIAKLILNSYRCNSSTDRLDAIESAFLGGYFHRHGDLDKREVDVHVAAGLFKCATHPFRSGMLDWPLHVAKLLELSRSRLQRTNGFATQGTEPRRQFSPNCKTKHLSTFSAEKQHSMPLPDMSWVSDILVPQLAAKRLVSSCDELRQHGSRLSVVKADLIRHKPNRRCLVRYVVNVAQSQSQDLQFCVIGKTRFKGVDHYSFDMQQALWRSGLNETQGNGVAVPRPLGIDPYTRTWFQECVPGNMFESIAANPTDPRLHDIGRRTSIALRTLHAVDLARPRNRYTLDDETSSLCKRLRLAASLRPDLAAGIEEVIVAVPRIGTQIGDEPVHGIHRDFYHSQVLTTDERTYLLDFDLFCEGPRSLDAGNYIGHLWELAIRFPNQSPTWTTVADQFSADYCDAEEGGDEAAQNVVRWAWMSLARHIWISTQIPARAETTPLLVESARTKARTMIGVPQRRHQNIEAPV